MTIHEAYTELKNQLYFQYDHAESANIADMVMEKITGLSKPERFLNGLQLLSTEKENIYNAYVNQLNTGKPVQQILEEAWFHGLPFYVNEDVLIPRPETDELVEWVTEELRSKSAISILDVGTGSGCISVSLKKELPSAVVHAVDVSEAALRVAKRNAASFNTDVNFQQLDFLDAAKRKELPAFDCIVSNPPYIKRSEAAAMRDNVLKFEPHLALFVENEDPLLFYRAIAEFAQTHLKSFGSVFLEINEALADDVMKLFDDYKFDEIELRADMQGKDRMIKACFL